MTPPGFVLALPHRGVALHFPAVLRREAEFAGLCSDEARLWISGDTPVSGLGPAVCLIGWAMSEGSSQWNAEKPAQKNTSPFAIASDLIANVWGAYAAIVLDRDRGELAVFTEPSGLLPLYRLTTDTHVLVSCDARLLHKACGRAPDVSWSELGEYLLYPALRQRTTCLRDLDELTPGALTYPARQQPGHTVIWQAADFLPSGAAPSLGEAAEELRALSVGVIGAWADLLDYPAVAASGGVDSSFICGALAVAGKDFACVTLATADASGDERIYARQLAAHLDVELAELVYDLARYDPARSASAGLPRPSRRSFMTTVDALLAEGAASLGARMVLDGNGGDNLFCFLHSAAPVVDRLRAEGPRPQVLGTLLDMCRITGCDIATMVKATAKRLVRAKDPAWPPDSRLLAAGPKPRCGVDPLTPWLELDTGRHAGKRDHLGLIMRSQFHVHGPAHGRRFSPLLSQPLLEFCLGIPTWTWTAGGRNRALARAAFQDELPASLLARTSKAGPDSFLRGAFERHRPALREVLLDGELARQGLLDRLRVEEALAAEAARRGSIIYRLLDLAEAENWARSWRQ